MVPTVALPPGILLTDHVTVLSVVFATDAVTDCWRPVTTWIEAGHTATNTFGVVIEQAGVAVSAGAVEVADVGLNTISAVSVRPPSSVRVKRSVPYPQDGAVTVAV